MFSTAQANPEGSGRSSGLFLGTFGVDKEGPAELEDITDVTGQPSADTQEQILKTRTFRKTPHLLKAAVGANMQQRL